jgi:hypothetical protein
MYVHEIVKMWFIARADYNCKWYALVKNNCNKAENVDQQRPWKLIGLQFSNWIPVNKIYERGSYLIALIVLRLKNINEVKWMVFVPRK